MSVFLDVESAVLHVAHEGRMIRYKPGVVEVVPVYLMMLGFLYKLLGCAGGDFFVFHGSFLKAQYAHMNRQIPWRIRSRVQ